jgi:hypothetical protein
MPTKSISDKEQLADAAEMLPVAKRAELDTALILKPQWSSRLMREIDPKTWEIRSANTRVRGRVGIMSSGVKELLGEAVLLDSFPLTRELYEANMAKHQTESWEAVAGRYKKPHVWVFEDGKQYSEPISVPRKNGQVIWVRW